MDQIQALTDLVNKFRDEREWRQFHNPKDLAVSVSLEASELLELFQWKNNEQVAAHLASGGMTNIKHELADVVIYLLMLASDLNINIDAAVREKLALQAVKYPVALSKGTATKYDKLSAQ